MLKDAPKSRQSTNVLVDYAFLLTSVGMRLVLLHRPVEPFAVMLSHAGVDRDLWPVGAAGKVMD